jgi:hypothetical protein
MFRHLFDTLSLISVVLLGCTLCLWVWSFWADPQKESLSFNRSLHVGVFQGRVEFFNIKEYGPYHGSIIALDGIPIEQRGFGNAYGVYYRHFRWVDSGAVLWTLSVTLVYSMVAFVVLPIIWAGKRWRAKVVQTPAESQSRPR